MCGFGDFSSDDLLQCINALALRVEGVHEMHCRSWCTGSQNWELMRNCLKVSKLIPKSPPVEDEIWSQLVNLTYYYSDGLKNELSEYGAQSSLIFFLRFRIVAAKAQNILAYISMLKVTCSKGVT
jgi:hypothetical protein